jgi:hypothetical protein
MCFLRREFRKSLIFYENLSLFILSLRALMEQGVLYSEDSP